jgi:hypothetical protein
MEMCATTYNKGLPFKRLRIRLLIHSCLVTYLAVLTGFNAI